MKRIALTILCLLIAMTVLAQEKKLLRGFDGGMMVHTGYLSGNLDAIGYQAKGAPLGIGGAMTTLLMFEEPASAWAPVDGTRYHRQGFMAIDPFVGCDFIVAGPTHLTLKVDYLCALSESKLLPHGPRVYIGFLFYH